MMVFRIVYGVFMKAVKWILVLIVLIPVVIMVSFFIRNKAVGPEGWARDDVEKVLRAQMKDPDSMVIRSSYVVTRVSGAQTEISICGVVDGRNAFGGYAGGMKFASKSVSNKELGYFKTDTVKLENLADAAEARSVRMLSGFEEFYWNQFCVDASHPALIVGD